MSFRDPNPVNTPGTDSNSTSFAINSRIMLTAIIIILFILILMVSLHLYSRWYLLRSRRSNPSRRHRAAAAAAVNFFENPSAVGLSPSVIKSLPNFTFSAVTAQTVIKCAVCLSEFEDNESGRVLPNCKHTFHVDCIDMWFHSHSSCPLCRSLVKPFAGKVNSAADEVVISIFNVVSGGKQSSGPDTNQGTGTSVNPTPEDSRRKPERLKSHGGITENRRNGLTWSHSFRSPMSKVISFTRNLSRDQRGNSSSSSIRIACK